MNHKLVPVMVWMKVKGQGVYCKIELVLTQITVSETFQVHRCLCLSLSSEFGLSKNVKLRKNLKNMGQGDNKTVN